MAYTHSNAIGEITEVTGEAIVIRTDGTEEVITLGTEIYLGDIVETTGDGAINIGFTDESSFAVSDNARVAIDEYVYDPVSESGDQDFSVMRGVFMYTSGLIGRENPDSVEIDTPVGSIGIRGTIIGGKIFADGLGESQISVIEGAIVVRNEAGEQLLTNQFDTVRLSSVNDAPSNVEQLDVTTIANNYSAIKGVSSSLFSSFDDQINSEGVSEGLDESSVEETPAEEVQAQDNNTSTETATVQSPSLEAPLEGLKKVDLAKALKAEKNAKDSKLEKLMEKAEEKISDENNSKLKEIKIQKLDKIKDALNENKDATESLPDTSTPTTQAETLTLSINALNKFSAVDGIEGIIHTKSDHATTDDFAGSRIVQLDIGGTLGDTINVDDFAISGQHSDYLRIIEEGGDFFLALKENILFKEIGTSNTYKMWDISSEQYIGDAITEGTSMDLADIAVSQNGVTSESINVDAVIFETAANTNFGETPPELISGVGYNDGSVNIVSNFDFKSINLINGSDKIKLNDFDTGNSTLFDFSSLATESNITGFSKDLSSVEHIFFTNTDDQLKIDIDNILRLLKTSDLVVGGNNQFVIHQNNSNYIADGLSISDKNGVTFVDSEGNQTQLDESNGFTYLGSTDYGTGEEATTYQTYQHDFGVVKIETQIAGAESGGL